MCGHKMLYGCPNCYTSLSHETTYGSTHHEAKCSHCGQDFQWDESIRSAGHGLDTTSDPPEPCAHQDRKRPGAMTPTFSKQH
jgi:hypothetical protein